MSIYSGFSTRQAEQVYNNTVAKLLHLLQRQIIDLMDQNSPGHLQLLKDFCLRFTRYTAKLKQMEERKYLPPKFTQYLKELQNRVSDQCFKDLCSSPTSNKTAHQARLATMAKWRSASSETAGIQLPTQSKDVAGIIKKNQSLNAVSGNEVREQQNLLVVDNPVLLQQSHVVSVHPTGLVEAIQRSATADKKQSCPSPQNPDSPPKRQNLAAQPFQIQLHQDQSAFFQWKINQIMTSNPPMQPFGALQQPGLVQSRAAPNKKMDSPEISASRKAQKHYGNNPLIFLEDRKQRMRNLQRVRIKTEGALSRSVVKNKGKSQTDSRHY